MEVDYFEKGYNSFIDIWTRTGCLPSPLDCGARYMKFGTERTEYLKGWLKARREYLEQ